MTPTEEQDLNKRFGNAIYEIDQLDKDDRTREVIRGIWERMEPADRIEFIDSLEKYIGIRRVIKGIDTV